VEGWGGRSYTQVRPRRVKQDTQGLRGHMDNGGYREDVAVAEKPRCEQKRYSRTKA
jgi:hypothetical protein